MELPDDAPRLLCRCDSALELEPATLEWLSKHQGPLAVLAVAGPARSGKSSLLNILFGGSAFRVGETVATCTRGIWARLLPPITDGAPPMLLLDTEGLGAPEGAAPQRDPQLLSLIHI